MAMVATGWGTMGGAAAMVSSLSVADIMVTLTDITIMVITMEVLVSPVNASQLTLNASVTSSTGKG